MLIALIGANAFELDISAMIQVAVLLSVRPAPPRTTLSRQFTTC